MPVTIYDFTIEILNSVRVHLKFYISWKFAFNFTKYYMKKIAYAIGTLEWINWNAYNACIETSWI